MLPCGIQPFNASLRAEQVFFFIKLSKVISSLQNLFHSHPALPGRSQPGSFNV